MELRQALRGFPGEGFAAASGRMPAVVCVLRARAPCHPQDKWQRFCPPFRDIDASVEYIAQEREDDLDLLEETPEEGGLCRTPPLCILMSVDFRDSSCPAPHRPGAVQIPASLF